MVPLHPIHLKNEKKLLEEVVVEVGQIYYLEIIKKI
jgi:hypothetical protein